MLVGYYSMLKKRVKSEKRGGVRNVIMRLMVQDSQVNQKKNRKIGKWPDVWQGMGVVQCHVVWKMSSPASTCSLAYPESLLQMKSSISRSTKSSLQKAAKGERKRRKKDAP